MCKVVWAQSIPVVGPDGLSIPQGCRHLAQPSADHSLRTVQRSVFCVWFLCLMLQRPVHTAVCIFIPFFIETVLHCLDTAHLVYKHTGDEHLGHLQLLLFWITLCRLILFFLLAETMADFPLSLLEITKMFYNVTVQIHKAGKKALVTR